MKFLAVESSIEDENIIQHIAPIEQVFQEDDNQELEINRIRRNKNLKRNKKLTETRNYYPRHPPSDIQSEERAKFYV